MPKDKRLYMTFPNGFWMHPKIRPLTDNAFRVFVEINGYSRLEDLDGRVPVTLAQSMWRKKALDELCTNHPDRPSLTVDGPDYVIWNYGEHQLTRADREEESARNSENGRKGGRPRSANRTETDPVSVRQAKKSQSQSQESEIDLDDVKQHTQSSHVGDAVASETDISDVVVAKAKRAGITDVAAVRGYLASVVDGPLTLMGSIELAVAITARSKTPVQRVDAYIATACRKSPDDVRWDYERLDLGAAS